MFRNVAGIACGAVLAIANISATSASPTAAAMHEGGYALAPFSFVKFCLDYPGDCPKSAGPGRIRLTSAHMAELASVNRAVNAAIRPTPDTSALRYWKLNVSAEALNVLNRVNVQDVDQVYGAGEFSGSIPKSYGDGVTSPANPTFGTPTFAGAARQIQLSLKLKF